MSLKKQEKGKPASKFKKPPKDEEKERHDSQSTVLVKLAEAVGIKLFHTPGADPEGFAAIPAGGHLETWRIGTKAFRYWLQRLYWKTNESAPNSQSMQDAIGVLRGKAMFDGQQIPVAVRIAEQQKEIWLDLGNELWQAVCINADGWRVVDNPPIRFIRPRGMLELPTPVRGGHLDELRNFVNVSSDEDWILLQSWLIASFRPSGPYPVLGLHGEQGSAKSFTSRILRSLVDPNESPLRSGPKEPRDLMIAGTNSWIVAFDNFSGIPDWLSDALCRLSTGGGFSTRELYTDGEKRLFNAMRPVLINGINELATRSDLLDRTIAITLPTIPESNRRTEAELKKEFDEAQPRILGTLRDAVSAAIRNVDGVSLVQKPRMADFAVWCVAAEPALNCEAGDFLRAYTQNRESLNESAIESAIIADPFLQFVHGSPEWKGTATELLKSMEELVDEKTLKRREWPKRPHLLSNQLRRIAPNLRRMGIEVEFGRDSDTDRRRFIRIERRNSVQSVQCVQKPTMESTDDDRDAWNMDAADALDAESRNSSNDVPF
jgi:hypothetical protein